MFVLGSNAAGGYNLTDSVRFRESASAYLSKTFSSASNRKTWTWSAWVKRSTLSNGGQEYLFSAANPSNSGQRNSIYFYTNDTLGIAMDFGATYCYAETTAVFRDLSAWYHIVAVFDTTQATDTNRMKLYVNNVQYTLTPSQGAFSQITQNSDGWINNAAAHYIGRDAYSVRYLFDGYMTEINHVDGQALTPSDFGEYDDTTGVWKPKRYTGSYGTNGFYLDMSTSGSTVTDQSGNGNDWTATNMNLTTSTATTYDIMSDVPTLTDEDTANFCTLSPLNRTSGMDISEGNLKCTTTSGAGSMTSTMATGSSGKYYAEFKITSAADSTLLGIVPATYSFANGNFWNYTDGVAYYYTGVKIVSGSSSAYGASYTTNDVIGVAIDMDAGEVTFYKNGVSQGVAHSGLSGNFYFAVGDGSSGSNTGYWANFGQRPFTYTPPTGYKKLNTYNLPDSAVKDGSKYFAAAAYTGNGTDNTPVNDLLSDNIEFSPDLVWFKQRSGTEPNILFDTIRGADNGLSSNATTAEVNFATSCIRSFDTNGFTLGTNTRTNTNTATYVAWNWRGSDSAAVSNTDGSITSTVSANTTSGFSIVTWTGNGSASQTVGHGLGAQPNLVIVKRRSSTGLTSYWITGSTEIPANQVLYLNLTNAASNPTVNHFDDTYPTTEVFSVNGNYTNDNGGTYVAYCFASVEGFSKIGSYTGNASTDGPFIYTGFRPAFLLVKKTSGTGGWAIVDTARDTYNAMYQRLEADTTDAENTAATYLDTLSNGFKLRTTNGTYNTAFDYIYMAFAENPFKNSLAR